MTTRIILIGLLFDLTDIVNFADDNFCVLWNKDLSKLIADLEKSLEMITKWLKGSGLLVNEAKTEICLFHTRDQPPIKVRVLNAEITSSKSMNVLGVIFDCKLTWSTHIANAISKSRKALFGLRLLKKFFNKNEMRTLIDANFY